MTRHEITFESGGDECAAWLYTPADGQRPWPIVVMAHGFSGTRRDGLGPFAERFATAGIAAMPFDYRGFGDSTGTQDVVDVERQLDDWRAAIACARSLDGVDPDRVATFGSSMGGGHALAAAAADPRVAAAVSQVPFLDAARQMHRPAAGVLAGMLGAAILDRAGAARGRPARVLRAVGQPGEPAFITAPHAEDGWRRVVAMGEDSRWRNRAAARVLLSRPYRPAKLAPRLPCPWLVCVGEDDNVATPPSAIQAARHAPQGELRTYPGVNHFDVYDGAPFEAIVADEIAFLRRHLLAEWDANPKTPADRAGNDPHLPVP
jgi:pimeloyl-ACP methyl ester carboxylesterase